MGNRFIECLGDGERPKEALILFRTQPKRAASRTMASKFPSEANLADGIYESGPEEHGSFPDQSCRGRFAPSLRITCT